VVVFLRDCHIQLLHKASVVSRLDFCCGNDGMFTSLHGSHELQTSNYKREPNGVAKTEARANEMVRPQKGQEIMITQFCIIKERELHII
jgi:hypothetical protein